MPTKTAASILLIACFAMPPSMAASIVGQTTGNAVINGTWAPAGTTLFGTSTVLAEQHPVTLQLIGGNMIMLMENSAVSFSAMESGLFELTVENGGATLRHANGAVAALGESSTLHFGGSSATLPAAIARDADLVCMLQTEGMKKKAIKACVGDPGAPGCSYQQVSGDIADLTELLASGAAQAISGPDASTVLNCDCGTGGTPASEDDCDDNNAIAWTAAAAASGIAAVAAASTTATILGLTVPTFAAVTSSLAAGTYVVDRNRDQTPTSP